MQSDPNLFQKINQSGNTPTQRLEALISTILQTRHHYIEQFGIAARAAKEKSLSGHKAEIMHRMFQHLKQGDSEAKDFQELMERRFQVIYDTILQLIIEGQKQGEFAQDAPSKLAFMIFTCIQGLTQLALNQPEEYEMHYPYTEIIMRMLKT